MPDSATPSPLEGFSGRIEPTRVSFFYQVGLGFVALTMVLLPVVYLALIAAVGWLVLWHLKNDVAIFEHVRGRGAFLALVVYLGPVVAGGIFILFLIKPLFSRAPKPVPSFKIEEKDEPVLFAFVRKICGLVGAPVPREIRLDSQVNASAGFRRGWLSFFGSDLVLVIGMPLVAGMTSRQVAGVLAHEFGHFAQGAGMRFSYIIRRMNGWFARVVYERDRWDVRLDEWAETDNWWLKGVFMLAKGGVWVGRKVLWGLMQAGHAISCFMSRQMEFDADSYEAKLAGSEEFARTAERLRLLGAAHQAAMNDAYQTFQTKALPDDLPALVAWREQVMPEETREALAKAVAESRTRWNETHPADPDRVKAALALAAPGVFRQETAAATLFADFAATCRAVTQHYFKHELEVDVSKMHFRSTAQMIQDRQSADDSDKNLDVFFGKHFHFFRMKPVEDAYPGSWREARAKMEASAAGYAPLLERYSQLQEKMHKQTLGSDLLQAQFTLPQPGEFALTASGVATAESCLNQTRDQITRLGAEMADFDSAANRRLSAALTWRQQQAADAKDAAYLTCLLTAQRALAGVVPNLVHASRASGSLRLLFDNAENHSNGTVLEHQVKQVAKRIEVAANHCIGMLGDTGHPYLDSHPPIAQVLHLPETGGNEYGRAFQLARVCSDALIPLFVRVQGDLCGIALAAEKEMETADLPAPAAPPPVPQPAGGGLPAVNLNLPAPDLS